LVLQLLLDLMFELGGVIVKVIGVDKLAESAYLKILA
jgi:hypothetical protein